MVRPFDLAHYRDAGKNILPRRRMAGVSILKGNAGGMQPVY